MSHLKAIFKPEPITLENGKVVKPPFRMEIIWGALVIVLLAISINVTKFDIATLFRRGGEFFKFLLRMFPIDFKFMPKVFVPMIQTIAMSFLGTLLAALTSMPFAYLSASNMNQNKVSRSLFRFVFSIFRTVPVLIIALVMTYIFGLGTFAGMIAIFLFTFSIITKMTYEQIELVDMGPFEALISTGSTRAKSFVVGVLPQISGLYASSVLFNLEMNIRSAAVLGYVGAGGIGILMNQQIGWKDYPKLAAILLLLFITVIIIEGLSRVIRKRLA